MGLTAIGMHQLHRAEALGHGSGELALLLGPEPRVAAEPVQQLADAEHQERRGGQGDQGEPPRDGGEDGDGAEDEHAVLEQGGERRGHRLLGPVGVHHDRRDQLPRPGPLEEPEVERQEMAIEPDPKVRHHALLHPDGELVGGVLQRILEQQAGQEQHHQARGGRPGREPRDERPQYPVGDPLQRGAVAGQRAGGAEERLEQRDQHDDRHAVEK